MSENEFMVKISNGGRIGIPAHIRKKLGVVDGNELLIRFQNNQLIISSKKEAISKAQSLAAKYKQKDSMVAELIADRRAASEKE